MNRILLLVAAFLISSGVLTLPAGAEVKVLAKAEIEKLTNEQIADIYIEAKIEAEAQKTFYRTGFTHKEFQEFREVLSFIVRLRQEMEKRKMDAPPIEEWLK